MRQFIGVVAARTRRFAHLVITQISEIGIVHLHIGAARRRQRAQLVAVRPRHVVIEHRIKLRVVLFADARATAAKVQHGGRWDRHLGRVACADAAPEIFEIGALNILDVAHFVDHAHHGWSQLHGAVRFHDRHRNIRFHAAELLQKIDVKIGAPELAVGDRFKADRLLKIHDFVDGFVLHGAQLGCTDLAFGFFVARIEQKFRPQKTADVVVAGGQGRTGSGHGGLLF